MPATRHRSSTRILAAALLAGAGMTAVGCASNRYTGNPTPELSTMSRTPVEVGNTTTVTFDTNLGAFWEDSARFLLLDRPSRLTQNVSPR